jgi:AraC-like DNA-binding protein
MARPRLKIDPQIVQGMAEICCTMNEIASVVGCSVDTLERRFADVIQKGRNAGKESLRRAQFNLAKSGNATMLIWLGKQLLDQKEPQYLIPEGEDGQPKALKIELNYKLDE